MGWCLLDMGTNEKRRKEGGEMGQLVPHLPSNHGDLSLSPSKKARWFYARNSNANNPSCLDFTGQLEQLTW